MSLRAAAGTVAVVVICSSSSALDAVVDGDGIDGTSVVSATTNARRVEIPRSGQILTLARAANLLGLGPEFARRYGTAEATPPALNRPPEEDGELIECRVAQFRRAFGKKATVLHTRHYAVLTTLGTEWAELIGPEMDAMFSEYCKRLGFGKRITSRFTIKVFSNPKEYLANGGEPGHLGHYSVRRKEIVTYLYSASTLRPTLYHEGVHQFVHFHVHRPPVWFSEGLAGYLQSAMPNPAAHPSGVPSFIVGGKLYASSARLRKECRHNGLVPLTKLLRMKYAEFHGEHESLHYAQAWGFTHFLLESGDAERRKLWNDYFRALRDGLNQEAANDRVLGPVDMSALERDFRAYVSHLDGWRRPKTK